MQAKRAEGSRFDAREMPRPAAAGLEMTLFLETPAPRRRMGRPPPDCRRVVGNDDRGPDSILTAPNTAGCPE